ncbi:hypothetical protein ANCCAN_01229 [Ancylostoma caninum]|uniref:Uncharacterized protein n=1 Tax=Ancylostoma caninum TaxID=29170 RepID=A0A368H7E7_ANCCA|nr:hypothetical protein ANCCAN_01229 [Ancylostoma caninum]
MAIARRIKVHVIALPPNPPIKYADYNSSPGYAALQKLTDSTLGFFITPYKMENSMAGASSSSQAISQIVDFYVKGVNVISVWAAKGPTTTMQYHVGSSEFYIAYRSMVENEKLSFTTPDNLALACDTGFWKLWRGQPKDGKAIVSYKCDGCDKDFNLYLMSSAALRTFVAVSSDESVIDASAPYAVTGANRTIVARIMSDDKPVTKDLTMELSSSIPSKANLVERPMCQFSVALGTVDCKATIPAILSVSIRSTIEILRNIS